MTCAEFKDHLARTPEAANPELEAHAAACPACATALQNARTLGKALKHPDLRHRAPDALKAKIAALARNAAQPAPAVVPARVRPKRWLWLAAPVAAAALIFIAVLPALRGPARWRVNWSPTMSAH